MHLILVLFALFSLSIDSSFSYFVTIEPNQEECFFDRVTSGSKMALTFEVSEGGFLDVDVRVYGPDGNEMFKKERESTGRYAFSAPVDGVYKYCFGNKMSSVTPKIIMFSMDIGEKAHKVEEEKDGDSAPIPADKLETMISELGSTLTSVKHEQEYMEIRERVHRAINDNTNSRVVLWAFFESMVLVAMTLGQIYYLKRFFEVRRAV